MTSVGPSNERSVTKEVEANEHQLRHILAPTDFSENAASASEYAARMAGRFGSDLTLIKARDLKSRSDVRAKRVDDIMQADDEKMLAEVKDCLRPHLATGAALTTETIQAQAHDLIPELAERLGADLIVMGNIGSSALSRIFLGSTTSRVIRSSEVPVLAVPLHPKAYVRKIGVAVEHEAQLSCDDLNLLRELARGFDADVVALHVGDAMSASKCAHAVGEIEERIDRGQVQLLHSPLDGTLHETLHQMIEQAQVDLLCMLRGKHSVLGDLLGRSETLRESFDCPVPLLTLKTID